MLRLDHVERIRVSGSLATVGVGVMDDLAVKKHKATFAHLDFLKCIGLVVSSRLIVNEEVLGERIFVAHVAPVYAALVRAWGYPKTAVFTRCVV